MSHRAAIGVALLVLACGGPREPVPDAPDVAWPERAWRMTDARALDGTPIELAVLDGEVVSRDALPSGATVLDLDGATVIPSFVDAHVHFSYEPVEDAHAAGGIAVAIDLASPLAALARADDPLRVLRSGPMITAPHGYPLDSWGHDGNGIECDDPPSCRARVETLVAAGADLIKVPIEDVGGLDDASLAAIVRRAHELDRRVVAHALTSEAVRRALQAGVDVLAHTPVTPLDDALVDAMRGHAVVSTLVAFGAGDDAVDNLRRLRAAGADVVYGTDLGNTHVAGIDPRELVALERAGLDLPAIVEAATGTPARVFGLARHGALTPGHAASFLVYDTAPHDAAALARPDRVVRDGVLVR